MTHANAITHCFNKGNGFRLPTIYELRTIISLNIKNSKDAFSPHPEIITNAYWSSTNHASDSSYAWRVDFGNGSVGWFYKGLSYQVVCLQD